MAKASDLVFDRYLPGCLLPPQTAAVTGGNFTTTTKAAVVDVDGLSISYTPPANCYVLIICQLRLADSVAAVRCLSVIDIGGVTMNASSIMLDTAGAQETAIAIYWGALTKDTAYTIKGQCYQADNGGGQTLTVIDDTDKTQLLVIPICRP